MELESTIELMISNDHIDRFIAEYWQLKIRHDKLKKYIQQIEIANDYFDGSGAPPYDCPIQLLKDQLYYMEQYMDILDKRRIVEDISL